MKKLLLTLLTLITVGTLARAEIKSETITLDELVANSSYGNLVTYTSPTSDIKYGTTAVVVNESQVKSFQFNKDKGSFFEVMENPKNYKIKSITVTLKETPTNGKATVYSNNAICYAIPETLVTAANVTPNADPAPKSVGTLSSTNTTLPVDFTIDNTYFGFFCDATASKTTTLKFFSVTVYYDDEVGGGEGGGDTPDTPTPPAGNEVIAGFSIHGVTTYSGSSTNPVEIKGRNDDDSQYGLINITTAAEGLCSINFSSTGSYKPGTYSTSNTGFGHLKLYASNAFTVTPANGVTITKIVVGFSQTKALSASSGNYSLTDKVGTWTGSSDKAITFSNTETGQANITYIDVTCLVDENYVPTPEAPALNVTTDLNRENSNAFYEWAVVKVAEPAEDGEYRYTTDGTDVTEESPLYDAANGIRIEEQKNVTVKVAQIITKEDGTKLIGKTATADLLWVNPFVDVLNATNFNAGTSYADKEYISPNSGVKYIAKIMKDGSNNMQMKKDDSRHDGIAVNENKNGYVVKNIKVNYGSGSYESAIYGSNECYADMAAFYTNNGTELAKGTGSFSYSLNVNDEEYKAFAFGSTKNAVYISSIEVEWMKPTERAEAPELVADCDLKAEDFEDKVNPFEDEAIVMVDEKDGAVYHYTVSTTGTAIRPSATVDDTTMVYDTDNGITVTESAIVTVAQVVDGIVGNTASVTLTKVDFEVPVAELVIESDGKDWGNVFKNEINVMISAENVGKHPTEIYYTTGTSNPFDAEGNLRDIAVKYESDDLLTFTANTQLNVMTTRNGKVSKASHANFKKFAPAVPYINILEANGQSIPAIGEVNVEISVAEEANPYIIYSIGSTPILNEAGDDFGENDDSEIADECPAKIILDTDDYTNEIEIHAVAIYEFVSASGETEDIYSQEVVYKGHLFAVGAEGDDSVIRYTPVTDHSALNTEHGYMVVARANEQETYVMMMHDDATNSLIHGTHAHLHDGGIHLPANSTDHNHAEFYLGGNATDGYYLWRRLKGETEISYLHNPNTDANGLRIAETDVENALFDIVYQLPAAPTTDPEAVALASADLNEGEMYIQFRNSGTTAMFNTTANTFNSYTPSSSLKNSNYVPLQLYASESGLTTGVEGVTVEDGAADDSEAVYYNLQGVRVSAPAAGQVYIVRRGASVAKQLVH